MGHLKYHQAVLDLLGFHLASLPRRLAIINEREAACATPFPASVREWFAIESAETLFCENSNDDQLQDVAELGDPQEAAQGYLKVATENQAVVAWYVRLDEGDDPPVYDNNDDWDENLSRIAWREVSKTFTNFIFDMLSQHHFHGWYSGMHLSAIDRQPDASDLQYLRSCFQEGPETNEPDSKVNRFFNSAGLVTIRCVTPDHIADSQAEWCIETELPDELFEFGKKLWHIQTLSRTLRAISCTVESRAKGDQVLQRLRAWSGT